MNKIFSILKKKSIHICRLEVNSRNKPAIKIYKKWGFKIDKYKMNKELT